MRHGPLATDAGVILPTHNYTHQQHLFCMDDSQLQIQISPLCLLPDTESTNSTHIPSSSFWRWINLFHRIYLVPSLFLFLPFHIFCLEPANCLTFLFLPSSHSPFKAFPLSSLLSLTSSYPAVSESDWHPSCSWWQSSAHPSSRNPCALPLPRESAQTHPEQSSGEVRPSTPGAARQTEPGAGSPCPNLRELAPQQTTCARLQPDRRPRRLGKPTRPPPVSSTANVPGGQQEGREGTGTRGDTHTHTR